MSNTMDAVSTAAGTLRDLATHNLQDDGLPPVSNDLISTIQRYSLTMSTNRRIGRVAGLSSVHCSIDDSWSDNLTRGSRGDGNVDDERGGDEKDKEGDNTNGGYREGPSWGAHTPALALETIAERNDDDVEMGLSCVSESNRSQELQAFFHGQELSQGQLQQQQEQEQWEQQQQQEQWEQRQLQQAIQEELARAEDRTTLMSDLTAGTLRSERHQARSFLNLRLCDTL